MPTQIGSYQLVATLQRLLVTFLTDMLPELSINVRCLANLSKVEEVIDFDPILFHRFKVWRRLGYGD